MRYLKFISFATIFPSDCYVNNHGLFIDNENTNESEKEIFNYLKRIVFK